MQPRQQVRDAGSKSGCLRRVPRGEVVEGCSQRQFHVIVAARDVDAVELDLARMPRIVVVGAHPAHEVRLLRQLREPEAEAALHAALEVVAGAEHVAVDLEPFRDTGLQRDRREAHPLDQKAEQPVAELERLRRAVHPLAKGDDACIADDRSQRLEVAEVVVGRGPVDGMQVRTRPFRHVRVGCFAGVGPTRDTA